MCSHRLRGRGRGRRLDAARCAGVGIPDAGGVIGAAGGEALAVTEEGERSDSGSVPEQWRGEVPCGREPEAGGVVFTARGEDAAIRTPGGGEDLRGMVHGLAGWRWEAGACEIFEACLAFGEMHAQAFVR